MDKKTVFIKTGSGENEVSGKSDKLYGDAKRILLLVDNDSTVAEISKRAPPSLRDGLNTVLQELVDGGYIRDQDAPVNEPQKSTLKMAAPAFKMAAPKAAPSASSIAHTAAPSIPAPDKRTNEPVRANPNADLDFSFITPLANINGNSGMIAREKTEATPQSRQDAERLKAEQAAQIEAVAKAAKMKAFEEAKERATKEVAAKAAKMRSEAGTKEKEKIDADAKARIEAEIRIKNEAEAAKLKAEQEALKARADLEATKARVEAEARVRIETELRIKQEAEAARLKAEKEAERIRLELAAAKAKAEEELRIRLEVEARAKAEEEARKKREEEAERLRIEKERAELEIARIKAEAEQKMREEAEKRVRAEVEARLKAEESERVRREAEAELLRIEKERAALEVARAKAEAEQKMRAEAEVRIRAEVEARLRAEELAKQHPQRSQPHEAHISASVNPVAEEAEQTDPAEALRQSFVSSFGQAKAKQKSVPLNFKLDTFSFDVPGQTTEETVHPRKTEVLAGDESRLRAALEQKAQKEAAAQRVKAELEAARLKAEQAEAARIRAEQQAARLKAEQEAYRLKVAQEEERAKAEAEANKLSQQQSKQWDEAQQRAAAQAKAEQERLAKQAAEAQLKPQQKTARVPRKKLPIGKMVTGLFALALLAVAGLPYVWPTAEYIAPLETQISAHLNQPVHIKKIHFALLPLPKLELSGLEVGSAKELVVENAVLNFDFSALFAQTRSINSLVLDNVTLSGMALDKALAWLQAAGSVDRYPVARMELRRVGLKSDEVKLPLLSGKADFDMQGKFSKAVLKSEDDKFGFELQALQKGFQLELNMHGSSLPIFPNIKFNDLSVNGIVDNGEFAFPDFFAHIYGGTVTGKGKLFWSNGWKLEGQLNAKSLELENLFPDFGVTGQLYGDASVAMYGPVLAQLDKEPRMEGSFEAKDGVINKLDIDTIARFGSRQGGGGRTSFTELTGTLKVDNRSQRISLNKITAGAVSGSGLFEVDDSNQLSGKLMVDIKGQAKPNVLLKLSGTPAEPLLQSGR